MNDRLPLLAWAAAFITLAIACLTFAGDVLWPLGLIDVLCVAGAVLISLAVAGFFIRRAFKETL